MWLPNEPVNIESYTDFEIRSLIQDLRMVIDYVNASIGTYEAELERRNRVAFRPHTGER